MSMNNYRFTPAMWPDADRSHLNYPNVPHSIHTMAASPLVSFPSPYSTGSVFSPFSPLHGISPFHPPYSLNPATENLFAASGLDQTSFHFEKPTIAPIQPTIYPGLDAHLSLHKLDLILASMNVGPTASQPPSPPIDLQFLRESMYPEAVPVANGQLMDRILTEICPNLSPQTTASPSFGNNASAQTFPTYQDPNTTPLHQSFYSPEGTTSTGFRYSPHSSPDTIYSYLEDDSIPLALRHQILDNIELFEPRNPSAYNRPLHPIPPRNETIPTNSYGFGNTNFDIEVCTFNKKPSRPRAKSATNFKTSPIRGKHKNGKTYSKHSGKLSSKKLNQHWSKDDVTCKTCGTTVSRPYDLPRHEEIHEEERLTWTCHLCPSNIGREDNFRAHMRNMHS
ncbi:hypothetical protein HK098_003704 [Nowakowskiella sp. JEL0407]|nr:hypothetical protein HK098_003704 [Nowakowskiella sp. JEL0407]